MKQKSKKYLETNENKNTIIQNLWDAAKAVPKRKFIAIQSYLRKQEKYEINNLTLHLKGLRKKKQRPKLVEEKKS